MKEYRVIKNKLYIYETETKEKELISDKGCEILKDTLTDIEVNKQKIAMYEKLIIDLKSENIDNYKLLGDLYKLGFCDLSEKEYERDVLTGQIIKEIPTHSKKCRNGGNE